MDDKTTTPPDAPKRHRRLSRKKTDFKRAPRGPWPIRALWEGSSEADRKRAHERCVAILEYWLGKATKGEIAQRLELPPLRVWQLSQQALSGMLTSLVHQPRWKEARGIMASRPTRAADVKALKRKIRELERENETLRKLTQLLQQFPPPSTEERGKKKRPTPARAQAKRRRPAPDDPA